MKELVENIIKREWDFLQTVNNIGGRASCQDDWDNFSIYRKSQFSAWNNETLESYKNDLEQYKNINYNPIMLKYAYMMESNDKNNFEKFQDNLPKLEPEKVELIEQLVAIGLTMREEFSQKYPKVSKNSRNIYTATDSQNDTSYETYLRAELSTYSFRTLYLYAKMIVDLMKNGKNIVEEIQKNTAINFGYSSLNEAEEKI